jgi:hypothetical protein
VRTALGADLRLILDVHDLVGVPLSLSLVCGKQGARTTLAFALTRQVAGETVRVVLWPQPLGDGLYARLVAWLGMFTDRATAVTLARAARERYPSLF